MKKIELDVKGMHCPSCEMLIKEELDDLDGVKSAEISHVDGKAIIEFDESKVDENKIKETIKNEGYEV